MSMNNNIILSICISAYNRRDLTCENVRKILRYKGDDIEVIVSDNASEDGTFEALREIEDKRLKIYRNEINIGFDGNTVRMLTYAVGKYVMTMNERDWVEPKDIQSFVRIYRNRECDFIIGTNFKELFETNKCQIDGRTFLILRFCHPGTFITRTNIYDELITKAKEKDIETYTEEWLTDMSRLRMALWLYAKRWERCRKLIRHIKPDKLAQVTQLRNGVGSPSVFFTPEARMVNFKFLLDNPYIKDTDMEMYIIGNYKEQIRCSLSEFYQYRKDPYTLERYHYKPDPLVCWVKIAIDFYKDILSVLREKGLYTRLLEKKLALITIQEYVQLCRLRLDHVKQQVKITK